VLTGRETIPAAFAAAAWRDCRTDATGRVRQLALGLGDGVGTVPAPGTTTGALAVLAAGGVLDLDGPASPIDEDALIAAGRAIDEREPDAFERRWRTIAPADAAVIADGGLSWSHGGLLWAARSVAQLVGAEPGVRLRLDDPLDGVRRLVLETLVPAVTGAELAPSGPADVHVTPAAALLDRLRPVIEALPTGRLRARGAGRDARRTLGLDRTRLVLLTGDGAAVAADWLDLLGIEAHELVSVPGCASPIRAGIPLPGVTIAVDDGGEVLVRSDAIAAGAIADDGWLHTGTRA
jgi:hypothetical protein